MFDKVFMIEGVYKMENKTKINNKAIGRRIREERELLALSREEFAEIISLSDYYVGQLERGERQMSLPVLVRVAQCLHISLDYLVFGKITHVSAPTREIHSIYDACGDNKINEIDNLLKKCSSKELELVRKLLKTILPYV